MTDSVRVAGLPVRVSESKRAVVSPYVDHGQHCVRHLTLLRCAGCGATYAGHDAKLGIVHTAVPIFQPGWRCRIARYALERPCEKSRWPMLSTGMPSLLLGGPKDMPGRADGSWTMVRCECEPDLEAMAGGEAAEGCTWCTPWCPWSQRSSW